jgi:hypothetical protein
MYTKGGNSAQHDHALDASGMLLQQIFDRGKRVRNQAFSGVTAVAGVATCDMTTRKGARGVAFFFLLPIIYAGNGNGLLRMRNP